MNNPIEEGHMDPLEEEAVHPAMPQETIGHGAQTSEEVRRQQNDLKRTTDARYTCDWEMGFHELESCESRKKSSQRFEQEENPEPLTGGNDAPTGHSRDATSMATAFKTLNRSLERFLTKLSRINERSEKS